MTHSHNPIARKNDLVIQEMPGEVLVYDLSTNKAHCLNETAAHVWRSCDGGTSISDIVKSFEKTSGGKVSEDLVWLAIDQLNENGLLEAGVPARFAGESRRSVIKKIGLASVVALPVIASLVAPRSAMASISCACTTPGDCITQTSCTSTVNCNGSGICAP